MLPYVHYQNQMYHLQKSVMRVFVQRNIYGKKSMVVVA